MSRWTRPERRRKAASSRSRQISVFGGSWCWACLVRFLRDLSLLPLQTGPARPPALPAAQEVRHGVPAWARRPLHSGASISEVLFPGSRPRGLPAAPPARAGGTPAETFTSKTRLRGLFRRCFFPVLAPVACRRPPPGARRRSDGDDFHLQNQAQVATSEVFFPGSCARGLPAPPPRRLRTTIVPGFYAPGRQNRRAARKLGDLALECAVILRSGGAKAACHPRNGRPGPPADR